MSEFQLPWLQLSIVIPLFGSLWVGRLRDPAAARRAAVFVASATFAVTAAAWLNLIWLGATHAADRWDLISVIVGRQVFQTDSLNAPKLPLVALVHLLTFAATPKTKIRRFTFAANLLSESILMALFSSHDPWMIVGLLAASVFPMAFELHARGKAARVFLIHMGVSVALLTLGCSGLGAADNASSVRVWLPILLGVLIRAGVAPAHSWVPHLFDKAAFGSALLFMTPMTGAYITTRLLVPTAPDWTLFTLGALALATALYAGGMALVQKEARRFFGFLFLSLSALVIVGLASASPLGVTGGLSMWLSVGLAMTGFGLTLRSIEARVGRLLLSEFHGLYDHVGLLAILFLLTGLAAVGFPGTFGFVGAELLMDGAVHAYPWVGLAVVVSATLNGIAVLKAYFMVFTGAKHAPSVSIQTRRREAFATLVLAGAILAGGIWPQPGVASRHRAAALILEGRREHQALLNRGTVSSLENVASAQLTTGLPATASR
jgi:NADH-quinone oxidoreductase subunit M